MENLRKMHETAFQRDDFFYGLTMIIGRIIENVILIEFRFNVMTNYYNRIFQYQYLRSYGMLGLE